MNVLRITFIFYLTLLTKDCAVNILLQFQHIITSPS